MALSIAEWKAQYRPVNEDMLETYGVDFEFLITQDPLRIWTVCDAGYGPIIQSGWHRVNAIGHYVTVIPFDKDDFIQAYDESEDESEEEEGE